MVEGISLESFRSMPLSELKKYTPKTMIYAGGGTRRGAVLAGGPTTGYEFAVWSFFRWIDDLDLMFRYGTEHIITHAIVPAQINEVTPEYREHLYSWVENILSGDKALETYRARTWRVRLLIFGSEQTRSELKLAARKLDLTDGSVKSLWFTVTESFEYLWSGIFKRAFCASKQDEAIRELCGAYIPPAELFLGYGKPAINPATVPPILMGEDMACYWKQKPGYGITDSEWREILYDYAFTRRTWTDDKTGRAGQVEKYRVEFTNAFILGLGKRLGPFWFPRME